MGGGGKTKLSCKRQKVELYNSLSLSGSMELRPHLFRPCGSHVSEATSAVALGADGGSGVGSSACNSACNSAGNSAARSAGSLSLVRRRSRGRRRKHFRRTVRSQSSVQPRRTRLGVGGKVDSGSKTWRNNKFGRSPQFEIAP